LSAGTFVTLLALLLVAYQAGALHKYEAAERRELGPADRARPIDSMEPDRGEPRANGAHRGH